MSATDEKPAQPQALELDELDTQSLQAMAELDAATDPDASFENEGSVAYDCACCDEPVRVPHGSTVIHNGDKLEHRAFDGLLVNGEPVESA